MISLLFAMVTAAQATSAPLVITQQACLPLPPAVQPKPLPPGICQPQKATTGSIVQIQLAGDPSVWQVSVLSGPARQRTANPGLYNSPGRIPGTQKVYLFEFEITGSGPIKIVMRESPQLLTPKSIGTFTFQFN